MRLFCPFMLIVYFLLFDFVLRQRLYLISHQVKTFYMKALTRKGKKCTEAPPWKKAGEGRVAKKVSVGPFLPPENAPL